MIDLRPMRVDDYVAAAVDRFPYLTPRRQAIALLEGGPAFAGWDGDQLLGVAGVASSWPGVGDAWAILTDAGRAKPIAVCRLVRDSLRLIVASGRFRRIQADVIAEFDRGCAWVERLGFKPEARLHRYSPDGGDMLRYVLLPEASR